MRLWKALDMQTGFLLLVLTLWSSADVGQCVSSCTAAPSQWCSSVDSAIQCGVSHSKSNVKAIEFWLFENIVRLTKRALKSLRETHAIQPMHPLTRHTSYFSRREITRIAPTILGHQWNRYFA